MTRAGGVRPAGCVESRWIYTKSITAWCRSFGPTGLRSTSSATPSCSASESANTSPAIEHPVDDDAGDRDVEPDWERPACDPPVAVEAPGQRPPDRGERERNDGGSQHHVREEQAEVQRADQALAGERPSARVD